MSKSSLSLRFIFAISGTVLLCMMTANQYMLHLEKRHKQDQTRRSVLHRASTVRAHLEYEINTTLNLTMGLVVFVASNPEFTLEEFERVAEELLQKAPYIRNIGLAKDNVISNIYPLKGNEAALGVRYLDVPDQRKAVLRAIETGNTVIAGPVDLLQGGKAFISRIPIYTGKDRHYWGIASVVINIEPIFDRSGLSGEHPGVEYALRGKDGEGAQGAVFFGDPSLFKNRDATLLSITLPVGSWQLAAISTDSNAETSPLTVVIKSLGLLLSIVVSGLVFALLISHRRIHHLALHDPLTGVSNRRYFDQFILQTLAVARRRKATFGLLNIDLNDFKPINDTYGHKQGDKVLIEVAQRLRQGLREADGVFRVGGDEFILVLEGPQTLETTGLVAEKLEKAVCEPITLDNGIQVQVGAAIGISLFPDHGDNPDALLKHADSQMYLAKNRAK